MVSIDAIKELRERTHLGMTECKKALEETNNNIEQAIEVLQKRGLKKVDDQVLVLEGRVKAIKNDESTFVAIAEVNCQTDFGAKSEQFNKFVNELLNTKLSNVDSGDLAKLVYAPIVMIQKQLGEKVVIRRVERRVSEGYFSIYNHNAGNIAVIAEFELQYDDYFDHVLADNIAMHIAACKPLSLSRTAMDKDLYAKKINLFAEEVVNRPEAMRQKIIDGKMDRWCSEIVLLEQQAIFMEGKNTKTIHELLQERGMVIRSFVRYERGKIIQ